MPRIITETPSWTWLTLCGLATLTAVDLLRRAGMAGDSVVVGSLPNLVAVPVLTFGFLSTFYPHRRHAGALTRTFWIAFPAVVVFVVAWEFLQWRGNLVFDPNDLVATGLGAALTLALYPVTQRDRRATAEAES